jgi:hypothetical protein
MDSAASAAPMARRVFFILSSFKKINICAYLRNATAQIFEASAPALIDAKRRMSLPHNKLTTNRGESRAAILTSANRNCTIFVDGL